MSQLVKSAQKPPEEFSNLFLNVGFKIWFGVIAKM